MNAALCVDARVVAWNVDGGTLRSLSRTGIEFKVDDRGSLAGFQVDDELYADNPFDRGQRSSHVAHGRSVSSPILATSLS